MSGEIVIRETVPADLAAIVEVHKKGFGYDKEAGLTAELLSDPTAEPTVSLLALRDGEAVGHILFTRCRIVGAEVQRPLFYILAPLAVVPSCQKQGVGGLLIAEGLQLLRERGAKLVFVLGHKEYYPRHGFIPGAEKTGISGPLSDSGKTCGLLDGAGVDRRRIFRSQRPGRMRRRSEPPRTLAGIKPHLR